MAKLRIIAKMPAADPASTSRLPMVPPDVFQPEPRGERVQHVHAQLEFLRFSNIDVLCKRSQCDWTSSGLKTRSSLAGRTHWDAWPGVGPFLVKPLQSRPERLF